MERVLVYIKKEQELLKKAAGQQEITRGIKRTAEYFLKEGSRRSNRKLGSPRTPSNRLPAV
jgi:hypothetical protein